MRHQRNPLRILLALAVLSALVLFSGCGGDSESPESTPDSGGGTPAESSPGESSTLTGPEQAAAYYAENPDFFQFRDISELPADLTWEDGMDQPEFASPDAIRGGTIRSFVPDFPPTIRFVGPNSNHSLRGAYLDTNVVGLIERHPNTGKFHAAVAEAWAIGPDKQTVYYKIDPRARFSDDHPVTVDDFFFLFFFMQSEFITAPWYNDFYSLHYESITRFDDLTFAIQLAQEYPEPLEYAGLRPVPEHFYTDFGPDYTEVYQWKFEPTTGAWVVDTEGIRFGEQITLQRVANWWGDQKKFLRYRHNPEQREFTVISDFDIAFKRFLEAEIDIFPLTLPEFWHEKSPSAEAVRKGWVRRFTFYNETPRPSIGIWLNEADPLLANPDIREGLAHAIDFDFVIQSHFRGDYQRLHTHADGFGIFSHPDLRALPFSIDLARAAFARAGFDQPGRDGILRDAAGNRLVVNLTSSKGPRSEYLPILQGQARKAGLLLNVEILESTLFFRKVMEKQHQAAQMGWGTSLPYPRFWEGFHSANANRPQTNNITNTADTALDTRIDTYRSSVDLDEKIELAHELLELTHQRNVFIPAYYVPFYRIGAWQWVQFPPEFDAKMSDGPGDLGLYWIDPEIREKTLAARRSGTDLGGPVEKVFDQWKIE